MNKTALLLLVISIGLVGTANCQSANYKEARPLPELQQAFLDLRFGMFIHFNIPTPSGHDWPDPN